MSTSLIVARNRPVQQQQRNELHFHDREILRARKRAHVQRKDLQSSLSTSDAEEHSTAGGLDAMDELTMYSIIESISTVHKIDPGSKVLPVQDGWTPVLVKPAWHVRAQSSPSSRVANGWHAVPNTPLAGACSAATVQSARAAMGSIIIIIT